MQAHLTELTQIVGEQYVITAGARLVPYVEELRGRYRSECLAVVLPADTAQVAAVVRCCAAAGVAMVPQGGNTGTMGGAVGRAGQVIINMARLNAPPQVDAANHTMRAAAGCILANLQAAALAAQRLFPLSLGAQGSCQLGGNLATNAGGINVLRYGNARDLVLGLRVVLADGQVWDGMNALRKNNTGYDLKHLFIGSEGTLGIITEATMKLFPMPRSRVVALAGLRQPAAALDLLQRLRAASSDRLTTFELMANLAVQSAVKHISGQTDPLRHPHNWYALIAADSGNAESTLPQQMETCLAKAMADDLLQDATIAATETQANNLIKLRENIVEAQAFEGGSIKHDVSVPVSKVPEFLTQATNAIHAELPTARPYVYGHMGDGNMHFNISQPPTMDAKKFLSQWTQINHRIHEVAHQLNGSFSAEHGIGLTKLPDMKRYKDPLTLTLYQQIKTTLDPNNLMNPGKLNP